MEEVGLTRDKRRTKVTYPGTWKMKLGKIEPDQISPWKTRGWQRGRQETGAHWTKNRGPPAKAPSANNDRQEERCHEI